MSDDIGWTFRQHAEDLFRFACRMTGDPDAAEDIVQEAFVKLSGATGVGEPRYWLFTVVGNLALDRQKVEKRRSQLRLVKSDSFQPSARTDAPDHEYERKEIRSIVRQALDKLSEKERTILLMREEGFSHKEIAAAVDTTTGSVGTMIARAMDKLADELKKMEKLVP